MHTLTKEFSFHALHRQHLPNHSAKENACVYDSCAKLHDHTYRPQVTLAGQTRRRT